MVKKIPILLILIVTILFSTGSFLLYQRYLYHYKSEFKVYILTHKSLVKTTEIAINPSELYTNSNSITWEDDNKEVIYNDVLYDIIHIKNQQGKVILIAVSDNQESDLRKLFASCYDIYASSKTKIPFQMLKIFLNLKCIVISSVVFVFVNSSENSLTVESKFFTLRQGFVVQQIRPPIFIA